MDISISITAHFKQTSMARCSAFGGCLAPTTLLLVVLTLLVSSTVAGMLHFCQYILRSIDDCFRFVNLFLKLQRCVTADFGFLVLVSRVEAFTMTLLATC